MPKANKSQLETMLESDNKQVGEATGLLSRLFRKVLADQHITASKFNRLMLRFLSDPKNRIGKDSKRRSSARGNLTKELIRPDMTWENFFKGIRLLNPIEGDISLRLKWREGRTTVHRIYFGEGGSNPKVGETESYKETKS